MSPNPMGITTIELKSYKSDALTINLRVMDQGEDDVMELKFYIQVSHIYIFQSSHFSLGLSFFFLFGDGKNFIAPN